MKQIRSFQSKTRQAGLTLIEALGVLGLLAVVIGAAVALLSGTNATQKAQAEMAIADSAASKINNIYSSRPSFAGLTTAVANNLSIWPEKMGNPAVNGFGAQVAVTTPPDNPKTPAANGARQFQLDWPNVSADSCAELAGANTTAVGIDVDGVEVYNAGVSPLDVAAVGANCGDGVTISIVYGKS